MACSADEATLKRAQAVLSYETPRPASTVKGPRRSICITDDRGDIVSILQSNVEVQDASDIARQIDQLRLSGASSREPSAADKAFHDKVIALSENLQANIWDSLSVRLPKSTAQNSARTSLIESDSPGHPEQPESAVSTSTSLVPPHAQGGVLLSFFNNSSKLFVSNVSQEEADELVPADPFYFYTILSTVSSPFKACCNWLSSSFQAMLDVADDGATDWRRVSKRQSIVFFDEGGLPRPAFWGRRYPRF
jgi:hypothetical protein